MKELIYNAYNTIGDLTPLHTDCGRLCGSICCSTDVGGGMWLFPGEREILLGGKGYDIQNHDIKDFGNVDLLICDGDCHREIRPLACRIFPLAPLYTDEEIKVRMDVRGMPLCPLVKQRIGSLDMEFIKSVKKALNDLSQNPIQKAYIKALSQRIDEYIDPLGKL